MLVVLQVGAYCISDCRAEFSEKLSPTKPEIEKKIREAKKAMEKAAKELDFMQAAKYRDEIKSLQEKI